AIDKKDANNAFGIHLSALSVQELSYASTLVNSNGGKWGYVTVAVNKKQCEDKTLQDFFNEARKKKLIPILRLTSEFDRQNGYYKKALPGRQAKEWADCLNGLNWPTREMHVVLFNEVNHGAEFGGSCNGAEYARLADNYLDIFHAESEKFVVMLSALDLYAPQSPPQFCDAGVFMREMVSEVPDIFVKSDAHASHSYPADNFSASPSDYGRHSVRGYEWELSFLAGIGAIGDTNVPVYITETGWRADRLTDKQVADRTVSAYKNVWLQDSRVKVVTPFIISYCADPFVNFSWKKCSRSGETYEQASGFRQVFTAVHDMQKQAGSPEITEKYTLEGYFPRQIVRGSSYTINFDLLNQGQGICDYREECKLGLIDSAGQYEFTKLYGFEPGMNAGITFRYTAGNELGVKPVKIGLFQGDKLTLQLVSWVPKVLLAPSLTMRVKNLPGLAAEGCSFELQVFDNSERLVFKKKGICIKDGIGMASEIKNVTLQERYRVVLFGEGYLPLQEFVSFGQGINEVSFGMLLPIDRNNDGKISFSDLML
ncbi:MAG: hypothetical protein ACE5DQ_01460, partial [Candidatus Paceibacterota bacterium]